MSEPLVPDDLAPLSEASPIEDTEVSDGPLGVRLNPNETTAYGDVEVKGGALGFVIETSERFNGELEGGERRSLPDADVLLALSRAKARVEGRATIKSQSEEARESWVFQHRGYAVADSLGGRRGRGAVVAGWRRLRAG